MMCWAWHGYSLDQPTGWVVMVWGKGGGAGTMPAHHPIHPTHGPGPASKPQQREGREQDPSWS